LLLAIVSRGKHTLSGRDVTRADLDTYRYALLLPLGILPAGTHLVSIVDDDPAGDRLERCRQLVRDLAGGALLFIVLPDRHDDRLGAGDTRRQYQSVVVTVAHDHAADDARRHTPARRPDVVHRTFTILKGHVEGAGEVLAQVVAGSRLQRLVVLHHRLDAEGLDRAGKPLVLRLDTGDHRHGEHLFGEPAVDFEHLQRLSTRLGGRGMGRVSFLPEKLGRA